MRYGLRTSCEALRVGGYEDADAWRQAPPVARVRRQ